MTTLDFHRERATAIAAQGAANAVIEQLAAAQTLLEQRTARIAQLEGELEKLKGGNLKPET